MSSLTLTIDEELLRRARIRALELGTSVNALVREWLENFADAERQRRATEEFLAIAKRSRASSGPDGRTWTRDDIYEERLGRYGR
jgi:plasmid stability protein